MYLRYIILGVWRSKMQLMVLQLADSLICFIPERNPVACFKRASESKWNLLSVKAFHEKMCPVRWTQEVANDWSNSVLWFCLPPLSRPHSQTLPPPCSSLQWQIDVVAGFSPHPLQSSHKMVKWCSTAEFNFTVQLGPWLRCQIQINVHLTNMDQGTSGWQPAVILATESCVELYALSIPVL